MPAFLDHDWVIEFALPAALCLALAIAAALGDRRRMKRSDADAVGFMPWTTVSFFASVGALVFAVLAFSGWKGAP